MHSVTGIEVEVTQEDITMGQRGVADYCPTARALKRRLNIHGYRLVRVWRDHIEILGARYELPKEVKDFMELYDDIKTKEQAKPFKFSMIVRLQDGDNQGGPEESNTGSGV